MPEHQASTPWWLKYNKLHWDEILWLVFMWHFSPLKAKQILVQNKGTQIPKKRGPDHFRSRNYHMVILPRVSMQPTAAFETPNRWPARRPFASETRRGHVASHLSGMDFILRNFDAVSKTPAFEVWLNVIQTADGWLIFWGNFWTLCPLNPSLPLKSGLKMIGFVDFLVDLRHFWMDCWALTWMFS